MKQKNENNYWITQGLSLFFPGYNNDEKNLKQIKCFINSLTSNHDNIYLLEQPRKDNLLDLTHFFETTFKDNLDKLKDSECITYLFRLDPTCIKIKEISDANKEEQLRGAHAVIIHIQKKKEGLEHGQEPKDTLHIYLDDSMESRQFKLISTLIRDLSEKTGYRFFCKNFGNFYSYQIFHGSSNSHFSLLYLLELWANDAERMREHLTAIPTSETMLFCDVFSKLKSFATMSKAPKAISLVKDYNAELEEIKFDKIRAIIIQDSVYKENFSECNSNLIKKVIEYSKQKKGKAIIGSEEAINYLNKTPHKEDRNALEICMKNQEEISNVLALKIPEKITHLKTFQKMLDKIKENCEPQPEILTDTL